MLRLAYAQGYFPMPEPKTDEIFWYFPDPRAIIPLDGFRTTRSLMRSLRNRGYEITFDRAFHDVMKMCAARSETWINDEFLRCYHLLHREGDAHSVEVWQEGRLVGGVYGVCLRGAFFGESMFHTERDASKVALYHLIERLRSKAFRLLEVQFMTEHLRSLGAIDIPGDAYKELLAQALQAPLSVRF